MCSTLPKKKTSSASALLLKNIRTSLENPALRTRLADRMSLTFRIFAGIKIYPSFISCDQSSRTFWAIWLKGIERVCGNIKPACARKLSVCAVSTLQRAFSDEGCHGESCGQYPTRVQALKLLPVYEHVGLPSHFLRLQTPFPR